MCLQLAVTAEKSADYELTPLSGNQYTSCLCGGERKTLSWNMNSTTIGEGRPRPPLTALHPERMVTSVLFHWQAWWSCPLLPRP